MSGRTIWQRTTEPDVLVGSSGRKYRVGTLDQVDTHLRDLQQRINTAKNTADWLLLRADRDELLDARSRLTRRQGPDMGVIALVLLVLALVAFIAATANAALGRINLVALGLALCVLAVLLGGLPLG